MVISVIPLWVDNGDGPMPNPALSQQEFDAGLESMKQQNVAALWQAAHDYEYAQISGTAVGVLAAGVAKGGPVSMAIQQWCLSIWTLYYSRKPIVTHQWNAYLLDFSSCGQIPHTIPELMTEVLGA